MKYVDQIGKLPNWLYDTHNSDCCGWSSSKELLNDHYNLSSQLNNTQRIAPQIAQCLNNLVKVEWKEKILLKWVNGTMMFQDFPPVSLLFFF